MDLKKLADEVVSAVGPWLERTLAPLAKRVAALEAQAPQNGRDGAPGASAYDVAVQHGFKGTPVEWLDSLRGMDGAAGRDGKDGRDGTDGEQGLPGADGARGADGLPGKDGDRGPQGLPGVDGKDGATGKDGRDGVDGQIGKEGPPGPQGDRGEPGTKGEQGERGTDGVAGLRGEKGEPGDVGRAGLDGKDGADGRDGRDGVDAFQLEIVDLDTTRTYARGSYATWRGGLLKALRSTDPLRDENDPAKCGWQVILNGFTAPEIQRKSEREIEVIWRMTNGERVSHSATFPVVIDRGVYKAGETYQPGDGVTWGGSFWIAQRETTAKPETNDDFRLAVKRGRDGKDFTPPARKT